MAIPVSTTKTFTATGVTEAPVFIDDFNVSVDLTTGSGTGTVVLQRSFDSGATWKNIEEYSADAEKIASSPESLPHRIECTAISAGSIIVRMSK